MARGREQVSRGAVQGEVCGRAVGVLLIWCGMGSLCKGLALEHLMPVPSFNGRVGHPEKCPTSVFLVTV